MTYQEPKRVMKNPFKKKYRIIEVGGGWSGRRTFYPERTILGFWCRWDSGDYGMMSFATHSEASRWIKVNRQDDYIIIHNIGDIDD